MYRVRHASREGIWYSFVCVKETAGENVQEIIVIKLLLLGVLTVTSYRPIPAQTKPECTSRDHCRTSIDDGVTKFGLAVSQDLLKDGRLHYGDAVYVDGYGWRIVNDCMNARHRNSVDLMVMTKAEERAVGVRKLKVWLADKTEIAEEDK